TLAFFRILVRRTSRSTLFPYTTLFRSQNEQKVASLQTQRNTINPIDTSAATEAAQNQESTVTTNVVVTRDASQMEASLVEERKRSEEHTSELQSRFDLVCRLLLEKKTI